LRIIAGRDNDFTGSIKYGTGVSLGYFSQDAAETIGEGNEINIIDFLESDAPTALIPKLRDMLGAFLFRGDDVYKSVSVLSGGEKSRLALLKMLLKPMNLLIMDEPTNHLDLHSKDILLDTLLNYKGTIVFVSHDRSFMEALSTKTLELQPEESFNPAKAKLYYGNYAYYLERINTKQSFGETSETGSMTEKPVHKKDYAQQPLSANEKRLLEKQKQSQIRKLEKREAEILKELEDLENEKIRLEEELAKPEVYSSGEKARAVKFSLDECVIAIERKTKEWEELTESLSNLTN
jgi:ATP-binding cassette subfamily F protein 3